MTLPQFYNIHKARNTNERGRQISTIRAKLKLKINSLNAEFFVNSEKSLSAYFQFAQMDLARASLVLIRVLRTLSDSIAKNLHKL